MDSTGFIPLGQSDVDTIVGNDTEQSLAKQFIPIEAPSDGEILGHYMSAARSGPAAPVIQAARGMLTDKLSEAEQLPFAGGAITAGHGYMVMRAANRIKEEKAKPSDFVLVSDYLQRGEEAAAQPWGQKVAGIVARIPGFAGEMALTGGAFNLAKAGATKAVTSATGAAAGTLAVKAAGNLAGVAAQTAANPQLIASNLAQRMTPPMQQQVTPEGDTANVNIGDGETLLHALPKAYLDSMIEIGTERSGKYLSDGAAKLFRALPYGKRTIGFLEGLAAKWVSKPGRTTAMLDEVLKQGRFDGIVGEELEEQFGNVLRMATGLQSPEENTTGQLGIAALKAGQGDMPAAMASAHKALAQIGAELTAFSIPGAASVASRGLEARQPDAALQSKLDAVQQQYVAEAPQREAAISVKSLLRKAPVAEPVTDTASQEQAAAEAKRLFTLPDPEVQAAEQSLPPEQAAVPKEQPSDITVAPKGKRFLVLGRNGLLLGTFNNQQQADEFADQRRQVAKWQQQQTPAQEITNAAITRQGQSGTEYTGAIEGPAPSGNGQEVRPAESPADRHSDSPVESGTEAAVPEEQVAPKKRRGKKPVESPFNRDTAIKELADLNKQLDEETDFGDEYNNRSARAQMLEAKLKSDILPTATPSSTADEQTLAYTEPTQQVASRFAQKVPINLGAQPTSNRQVAARDIESTMASEFGVPLKSGRVPKPASGIYKMYSEVARQRGDEMASLSVSTHEIAHHVDKQTEVISDAVGGINRPRWSRLIDRAENQQRHFGKGAQLGKWGDRLDKAGAPKALSDAVRNADFALARTEVTNTLGPVTPEQLARTQELAALDYIPSRGMIQEGWAEFARNWLTTDNAAKLAPETAKWFENEWMPAHPQWAKAYAHAKELIDNYRGMTAEQRATANKAMPPDKPTVLDQPATEKASSIVSSVVDAIRFQWENIGHYIQKIEDEALSKGMTRAGTENTLPELHRWVDGTFQNHTKAALFGDGIKTIRKGQVKILAPSVAEIVKPLTSPAELEEWDNYYVARHVLQIEQRQKAQNQARQSAGLQPIHYNPGMRYEDAQVIVDRIKADQAKHARFEQVSVDFGRFRDAILDMRADAGEITQELADKLKAYYQGGHASLRRVHPQSLWQRLTGHSKMLNVGGTVKRRSARGSGLPIMPQIFSAMQDVSEGYHTAMTHVFKEAILNTVVKAPKLGLNGVEGMGKWAEVVDANLKPQQIHLDEILSQLVNKNVIEQEDADLIRAVNRLRHGTPTKAQMKMFKQRYGTDVITDLITLTHDVPSPDEVLLTFRPDYRPSGKEFIERMMIKGKPVLVEWNPYIYKTLDSMGPLQLNAFEKVLSGFGAVLSTGATGINVAFGVQQLFSDYATYQFQARKAGVVEAATRPFASAGKIAHSISNDLLGLSKRPVVRLLEENYGTLFEDVPPNQAGYHQILGKLVARGWLNRFQHELSSPSTYAQSLSSVGRKIGNVLAALDTPMRLAEGEALLRHYGYVEKRDAKGELRFFNEKTNSFENPPIEVIRKFTSAVASSTVDFRRGGRSGRYVNRVLFRYFNAWTQGLVRMGQSLNEARQGDQRAVAGVVAGTIGTVAMSLLFKLALSSPDDEEERGQFDKSRNWSTSLFRIRKPQAWCVIPNLAEAMLDMSSGKPGAWKQYAREELRQQSFFELPMIDEDPILGNVGKMPLVGPLAEAAANKDTFRQRRIEPSHLEGLPAAERYGPRTSTLAKAVGQVTGPALNLGPEKLDFLADRMTGGLATGRGFRNPFQPYHLNASKQELEDRFTELRSQRQAASIHGKPWTAEQEVQWDRVEWAQRATGKLYKAMDGKTEQEKQALEKYVSGVARYALGKRLLGKFPDPISGYSQAPKEVQELVDERVLSLARTAVDTKPEAVTAKERDKGITDAIKAEKWKQNRDAAISELKGMPLSQDVRSGILTGWLHTYKSRDARFDHRRTLRQIGITL